MNKNKSELKSLYASKSYRVVLWTIICICVVTSAICYTYYAKLQDTVVAESSSSLQEISRHIGSNASRTITDTFSVLETVSTVLKTAQANTYAELAPIIQEQQSYWDFQNILLVDEDGIAYDGLGKKVVLGSSDYLREVIVKKQRSMSASQLVNNREYILFTIPVTDLQVGGLEIRAVMAAYDLKSFDQILKVEAFEGQGYAHIIRRDGTMAIRSSSVNAAPTGYNLLASLEDAVFENDDNLETIKSDIAQGKSGMTIFRQDGRRMYMVYTSLITQEWALVTFVPVSVVNFQSESLLRITIFLCIMITLSFVVLIIVLMRSSYQHKIRLEQIAFVDPVTGGNTIQKFYDQAKVFLEKQGKPQYALVYTNIEKFKVFNEQFGSRSCDDLLRAIEKGIEQNLSQNEIIGRLSADNFCIMVEYTEEQELVERFNTWYEAARRYTTDKDAVWLMPLIEYGVYVVSNDTVPVSQMIDRAKMSLKDNRQEIHGKKMHYSIYDDATRKRLFREKHLEDMMEKALEDQEFQVYLQPKYRVSNETIGGAEALVRWQSSTEGMIYPDEFISLFEKNGFVIQLDLWVFEQVCRTIRSWLDRGIKPVKISVNCSRVHLKNPKFLQYYLDVCNKYDISPSYLEIELTENVVFEDVEYLTEIINNIHKAGFGCSMDDFGSGYSSLNMIQDIPVDTIKLDKVFFRNGAKDIERTESVVGSIIQMTKALKLETVAEGVEEHPQVVMLKRLGCDYIQGYYYAKPMPISQFEQKMTEEAAKAVE